MYIPFYTAIVTFRKYGEFGFEERKKISQTKTEIPFLTKSGTPSPYIKTIKIIIKKNKQMNTDEKTFSERLVRDQPFLCQLQTYT